MKKYSMTLLTTIFGCERMHIVIYIFIKDILYVCLILPKKEKKKLIFRGFYSMSRVVYCVVTEANPDIMSWRHDTYLSRHYAGCRLYPDELVFVRIFCVF